MTSGRPLGKHEGLDALVVATERMAGVRRAAHDAAWSMSRPSARVVDVAAERGAAIDRRDGEPKRLGALVRGAHRVQLGPDAELPLTTQAERLAARSREPLVRRRSRRYPQPDSNRRSPA